MLDKKLRTFLLRRSYCTLRIAMIKDRKRSIFAMGIYKKNDCALAIVNCIQAMMLYLGVNQYTGPSYSIKVSSVVSGNITLMLQSRQVHRVNE